MIDLTISDIDFRFPIESTFFVTMISPDDEELWCLNGIRLEHLCRHLLTSRSAAEENTAEEHYETSGANEKLVEDDVSISLKPPSKSGKTREKSKNKGKKTASVKKSKLLTDTFNENALEVESSSFGPNGRSEAEISEISRIVNDGATDVGLNVASTVQEFGDDFEENISGPRPSNDSQERNRSLFTGLDETFQAVRPLVTSRSSASDAGDDEENKGVRLTETFESRQVPSCLPVTENFAETNTSISNHKNESTSNDALIKDTENDTNKPECMADGVSDIGLSDDPSSREQYRSEVAKIRQNEFAFRSSESETSSQQISSKSSLETVSLDEINVTAGLKDEMEAKDKAHETSAKASNTRPSRRQSATRSSPGKQVPTKSSDGRTSRNATVKSASQTTVVGGRRSNSIDARDHLLLRSGRTLSVDRINRCFERSRGVAKIRRRSLSVERCLITLTTTTETTVIRPNASPNDDVIVGGKLRDKDPVDGVEPVANLGSNGSTNSGRSSGFDCSYDGRTPEVGEQLSGFYDSTSTEDSVLRDDNRDDYRPIGDYDDRPIIANDRADLVLIASGQSSVESEDITVEVEAVFEDETVKVNCIYVVPFFETLSADRDENERFTLISEISGQKESNNRTGIEQQLQESHEQENFTNEAKSSEDEGSLEDDTNSSASSEVFSDNSQAIERIENDGIDPCLLELQKNANGAYAEEAIRANSSSDSEDSHQTESEHKNAFSIGQMFAIDNDMRSPVSFQSISKDEDFALKRLLPEAEGDLGLPEQPVEKLPESQSETPPENIELNDLFSKESSNFNKITEPSFIYPSPEASSNPSNEITDTTDSRTEDNNKSNNPEDSTLNKVRSISDDEESQAQESTHKTITPPPPPPSHPPSSAHPLHPLSEFTEKSVQDGESWVSSDCVGGAVLHEYAEVVWFYRNYFMTLQSSATSSSSSSDNSNEDRDSVIGRKNRSVKQQEGVQLTLVHAPNFTWTWRDVKLPRSPSRGGGAVAHLDHVATLLFRPVRPTVERFDLVDQRRNQEFNLGV